MGIGEAVDTIPSILNKCLFVSPDGQTDGRPGKNNMSPNPEGGGETISHERSYIYLRSF